MSLTKKILVVMAALLSLLVLLVVVLQYGVDTERYRTEIQRQAAAQGIELRIAGDMHWSLFPRPGLAISDIAASIPSGEGKLPLHIGGISVAVELPALLRGDIVFDAVDIFQITATFPGSPSLLVSDAMVKARHLNGGGRAFPVSLSLLLTQGGTAATIQLIADANIDAASRQLVLQAMQMDADMTEAGSVKHLSLQGAVLRLAQLAEQLDIGITAEQLALDRLLFTQLRLGAGVSNTAVTVREFSALAYQGQIRGSAELVPAKNGKRLTLDIAAEGLQLAPLLADMKPAPSGVAAGSLKTIAHISAQLGTAAPVVKTLVGNVQTNIDGLVLDDMNLEQQICEAAAGLGGESLPARQWSPRTEFRAVSAKANINNGVVFLSPVQAQMDNLNVTGQGVVNLADHALDIPLDLKLLGDNRSVSFCPAMNPRLADITWPLRCKGNYVVQKSKDLCGVDQSRMNKLIVDIARKELRHKLDKTMGAGGDKIQNTWQKLFN